MAQKNRVPSICHLLFPDVVNMSFCFDPRLEDNLGYARRGCDLIGNNFTTHHISYIFYQSFLLDKLDLDSKKHCHACLLITFFQGGGITLSRWRHPIQKCDWIDPRFAFNYAFLIQLYHFCVLGQRTSCIVITNPHFGGTALPVQNTTHPLCPLLK